jgi:hypothetical protein
MRLFLPHWFDPLFPQGCTKSLQKKPKIIKEHRGKNGGTSFAGRNGVNRKK